MARLTQQAQPGGQQNKQQPLAPHLPQKRPRKAVEPPAALPANVIIQFRSETGEASGTCLATWALR